MKKRNKHMGSSLEDFLKEEGHPGAAHEHKPRF